MRVKGDEEKEEVDEGQGGGGEGRGSRGRRRRKRWMRVKGEEEEKEVIDLRFFGNILTAGEVDGDSVGDSISNSHISTPPLISPVAMDHVLHMCIQFMASAKGSKV